MKSTRCTWRTLRQLFKFYLFSSHFFASCTTLIRRVVILFLTGKMLVGQLCVIYTCVFVINVCTSWCFFYFTLFSLGSCRLFFFLLALSLPLALCVWELFARKNPVCLWLNQCWTFSILFVIKMLHWNAKYLCKLKYVKRGPFWLGFCVIAVAGCWRYSLLFFIHLPLVFAHCIAVVVVVVVFVSIRVNSQFG